MKHTIALLLTACSIAISPLANAGTNSGIIYFQGSIVNPSCTMENQVNAADFFVNSHKKQPRALSTSNLNCEGPSEVISVRAPRIYNVNESVPGAPDAYVVEIQYD